MKVRKRKAMCWRSVAGAIAVLAASLTGLAACAYPPLPNSGKVHVDRWAVIRAADKDAGEILDSFNQAEDALQSKNLDGLMALYSEQYRYHGLSKSDLRTMWREIFDQYDQVTSNHIFSRIQVVASGKSPTAEVICTGNLWGTSKETGKQVIIDSWFYETHHLAYEGGKWRILGHGEGTPQPLRWGGSPHPFF